MNTLRAEEARMLHDPTYYSFDHQHHSYKARGRYAQQIQRWLALFPRKQLCVVLFEEWRAQPQVTLAQICRFLGLPEYQFDTRIRHNASEHIPTPVAVAHELAAYFRESNRDLENAARLPSWLEYRRTSENAMTALIITGMHRSGTSLLASLLQQGGVEIGTQLLAPTFDNPRGYFEDEEFMRLHDDMLYARGKTILVERSFAPTIDATETARAQQLIAARAHLPLWGWKDPRTSLFLDFLAYAAARSTLPFRIPQPT